MPVPARLEWRAARVVSARTETSQVRTIVFSVPEWPGHRAGQHLDLRLTAEDGYQAQRSYSIASAPGAPHVELTIERLEDGEVSPYLADVVRADDVLEVRGPIGGYFVWEPDRERPLGLIAGGSGIVPLMSMLRYRAALSNTTAARLLYSARNAEERIYRHELADLAARADGLEVTYTLTRLQPPEWQGYARRIDREMLSEVFWPSIDAPMFYVCGPTPMVEAVANQLVELGHPPRDILTERFGPTGGS
jgi:ferredoxin-NADP reductase